MNISSLIPLFLFTLSLQAHAFTGGFVENRGQWPDEVRYRLQLDGLTMWITDRGAVYDLHERVDPAFAIPQCELFDAVDDRLTMMPDQPSRVRGHVLRMEFVGASNNAEAIGGETMSGRVNFFIGNDERRWGRNCRIYSSVRLEGVYEGIDAVYYLDGGMPRYDLIVAPGADIARARMTIEGTDELTIAGIGRLVIGTSLDDVEMRELTTFQTNQQGERCQVTSRFAVDGEIVSFVVGEYDRRRPLVVDPLIFSTLLGGGGMELPGSIAVDVAENVYVAGMIVPSNDHSRQFPTTPGAYDTTRNGDYDIYVTKLSPHGDRLLYSTYIGSVDAQRIDEPPIDLVVSADGRVYLATTTGGPNNSYPTTPGAFDPSYNGKRDVVISSLSVDGDSLLYSTYLGGAGSDFYPYIALRNDGALCVGGSVEHIESEDTVDIFPTTSDAYDRRHNGSGDLFVTVLSPNGDALEFSTLIGGSTYESLSALTVDSTGAIYVSGRSSYPGFPVDTVSYPTTDDVYDDRYRTDTETFLTKLSADGSELIFSTYVVTKGSVRPVTVKSIVLGAEGEIYLGGSAFVMGNEIVPTIGVYDDTADGGHDVVVIGMSADGKDLLFLTFVGGIGYDSLGAMRMSPSGELILAGTTAAPRGNTFPTTSNAFDSTYNDGSEEGFVARLSIKGDTLSYGSYIGGRYQDRIVDVVVDADGAIYLFGYTGSLSGESEDLFPLTPGAFDVVAEQERYGENVIVKMALPSLVSGVGADVRRFTRKIDLQ